jgi:hypothetical protein
MIYAINYIDFYQHQKEIIQVHPVDCIDPYRYQKGKNNGSRENQITANAKVLGKSSEEREGLGCDGDNSLPRRNEDGSYYA